VRFAWKSRCEPPRAPAPVPFYGQTLEFTCGPAALMMAMARSARFAARPAHRIKLWRESTTIYMTSGHGGCKSVRSCARGATNAASTLKSTSAIERVVHRHGQKREEVGDAPRAEGLSR
jgi:hypothetical protein